MKDLVWFLDIYYSGTYFFMDLVHLPEWVFDQKRISANSNLNPNLNSNPNPKAQEHFWENEMTSFFGQVSRYASSYRSIQPQL